MATLKVTNIKNESFAGDQLYLKTDGTIGIGTTSPANKLHVVGTTKLFGTTAIGGSDDITPSASGVGQLTIDGNGYTGYIAQDATAMYFGHNSNTRDLTLQTNESDRLTIDGATGKIGIWTTDPKGTLDIHTCGSDGVPTIAFGGNNSASTGTTRTDETDKAVRVGCVHKTNAEQPFAIFYAVAGTSGHNTVNYGGGTSWMNAATRHQFHTAADTITTAGSNKMTIHQGGDVEIIDGNLKVADGHGINFYNYGTGTNISSNLLDDYEEGIWTPSAGVGSFSTTSASYIKIGSMIFIQIYGSFDSTTGAGTQYLSNLPFAAGSNRHGSFAINGNINLAFNLVGQLNAGSAYICFATPNNVKATATNCASKFVVLSGTYNTDF